LAALDARLLGRGSDAGIKLIDKFEDLRMELTTTLTEQGFQNRIREVGINPNYWYPVSWANILKPGQVIPVVVWQQPIAVYRDTSGELHALEDACPHKGVTLHKGEVQGCHLLCPYHGWEFNGSGDCVKIPYFPPEQKLPPAKARSYPVREKYNLIWIFPGDANLADGTEPRQIYRNTTIPTGWQSRSRLIFRLIFPPAMKIRWMYFMAFCIGVYKVGSIRY
jgi:nitrite reductase/ring-hydroxylating ferredoxin subunit